MKKIISFEKKLDFKSMIGEISAISFEHTLDFVNESNIEGDFLISGKYKLTEASVLEEDFNYKIPVDIILDEKLDLETAKIDVEDFYYEIEYETTLICHIDIKIEGVEMIESLPETEDEKEIEKQPEETINNELTEIPNFTETVVSPPNSVEEDRECDNDLKNLDYEDIETGTKRDDKMEKENKNESIQETEQVGSLFSSFKESDETFKSYSVYIIRENETLQTLMEKYNTTKEDLESYNDLSNISVGSKIIIPNTNE